MRKKKIGRYGAAFFALPLVMASCYEGTEPPFDSPPPAIALYITVHNMTDTPTDVRMRHVWFIDHSVMNSTWVYTDWSKTPVHIKPGESRPLADETIRYEYNGEGHEMAGFILWAESPEQRYSLFSGIFSFEMKIDLKGKTLGLAGHNTEEPGFDETGLGYLQIERMGGDRFANLRSNSNKNAFMILRPFVIRAYLTLNADGTYSFQYDDEVRFGCYT
jgi:hypothetical protein